MTTRFQLDRARFNSGGGAKVRDAEFEESKHPRAANGEFGQGSGSGESSPKSKPSLPPEPGTAPVKEGYVRLYHQTGPENFESIKETGINIEHAKGIEGPRAVYAGETPFYGKADSRYTIEFQVPKEDWDAPFVLRDVKPEDFLGAHEPWHKQARYLENNPKTLEKALAGEFDDLGGDYKKAVEYIKAKHSK
jgi:hypothetical protein